MSLRVREYGEEGSGIKVVKFDIDGEYNYHRDWQPLAGLRIFTEQHLRTALTVFQAPNVIVQASPWRRAQVRHDVREEVLQTSKSNRVNSDPAERLDIDFEASRIFSYASSHYLTGSRKVEFKERWVRPKALAAAAFPLMQWGKEENGRRTKWVACK